ncbi:YqgQ family protein [Domibacillus indicus]|uniref:YqgQ family protein n=1 Tax=Domibacillus TaxID=1433999 RepID=UPI001F5792BC|nr:MULTISPECIES: YqgQ family protein [Domibacillus]MCI2254541.1 YqgQ family protein [Domibacillus sp. PGB-M46]MCM3788425.1 YqgQ family protein [Domibacillus indicus]
METIFDVQQLLKRYGVFVYIGNRVADLQLMELELKELYQSQLIEPKEYQMALLILRQHIAIEKEKEKEQGK